MPAVRAKPPHGRSADPQGLSQVPLRGGTCAGLKVALEIRGEAGPPPHPRPAEESRGRIRHRHGWGASRRSPRTLPEIGSRLFALLVTEADSLFG